MAEILHITTAEAWERARISGEIRPATFEDEGFVHCCTAAQLASVVDRFYAGVPDVVVLHLDGDALARSLRWETARHPDGSPTTAAEASERFPHVYEPIPTGAVRTVVRKTPTGWEPDPDPRRRTL